MGYELHITRADDWTESEASPITLPEWRAYLKSDCSFRIEAAAQATTPSGETIRYASEGLAVWTAHPSEHDGDNHVWFDRYRGRVVVKGPDKLTLIKMREVAACLGARVQGDDGEWYEDDGGRETRGPWWRRFFGRGAGA